MTEKIEVTEALLIDTIRLVLFYTWDPIGMSMCRTSSSVARNSADGDLIVTKIDKDCPACDVDESEYDGYIHRVLALLVERKSCAAIYRCLRDIEKNSMGCGNPIVTRAVAKRLHAMSDNILAS